MAEIFDWDVTAGNNNNAPPNGFPEGQTPASLNNSSREVMAVIARYYEVFSGGLVTTGSSGSYVLSVNQVITSYSTGLFFSFTANHDNPGAALLNVNGVGSVAVTTPDGSDLLPGVIRSGGVYSVTYTGTTFILHAANVNLPPNFIYYPWNFDSSGDDQTAITWNKPAGLTRLRLVATAGGGGGEGGRLTINSAAGNGASSGTAEAIFNADDLGATENILIGGGGQAGGAAAGVPYAADGFTTSFGALVTVLGGGRAGDGTDGGARAGGIARAVTISGTAVSSLTYPGVPGMGGVNNNAINIDNGTGGISIYGGPGIGRDFASGGTLDGIGFGSGGGGGMFANSGSAGAGGLVILQEFF
jgi:hypothetical protein